MSRRAGTHPGLWALAITAFVIGVAECIVAGVRCFCQRGYKGRRPVPGGRRESRRSWRRSSPPPSRKLR